MEEQLSEDDVLKELERLAERQRPWHYAVKGAAIIAVSGALLFALLYGLELERLKDYWWATLIFGVMLVAVVGSMIGVLEE